MDNLEYVKNRCDVSDLRQLNDFPRYIKLETTNKCTASCVFCGILEWSAKMKQDYMDDFLFDKISSEIIAHKQKVKKVALFVGNEPLTDKNLEKRIIKFKENGVSVNFSSNGSLMNAKRAKTILQSGVDAVNFSVDGLDLRDYESTRRGLKFILVLGNVLEFIKLRDLGGFKTSVRISIIKTSKTLPHLAQTIKFWERFLDQNKGDGVRVDELSFFYGAEVNYKDHKQLDYSRDGFFEKVKKQACHILWNTMVIKTDGSVALCNCDQARNFSYGNLREKSIVEIWQDLRRAEFCKTHLEKGRGAMQLCKDCIGWLAE